MRIHSDILTGSDILQAASAAGPEVFVDYTRHGSRSRKAAWNVTLTGTSSRRPNTGNRGGGTYGGDHAATWDEWGIFLGELFRRDPGMTVPGVYDSAEHFRWATTCRFDDLKPADQHGRAGHRWTHEGEAASGSYSVYGCPCGAQRRQMAYKRSFAEIS